MTIQSPMKEITETQPEVLSIIPDYLWRPKWISEGPVPANQKYAILTVALAPAVTIDDYDALITAIEGITGIQKALINFYGKAPSETATPEDYELYLQLRLAYRFLKWPSPSISISPSPSISLSPSMSISPSPLP